MKHYETNFVLDLDLASAEERVEIRNPSGSGKHLHITRIGITSEAGFSVFTLKRYGSHPTHGTGGDAPTQHALQKWHTDDPSPSCEIWSGEPGVALIWPGSGDDYTHDFQLDPSDAGDDDKLQFNQYLTEEHTVIIESGTSASLAFPAGQAVFTVKILIRELPELPAEHIASAALPTAGEWTSASFFALPRTWSSVGFRVSYTAATPSVLARPRMRIVWSDGTNDIESTVVDMALDVSGGHEASQGLFHSIYEWTEAVNDGETIVFGLQSTVYPGATGVRLDVAEIGDTSAPGTVAVTITGK